MSKGSPSFSKILHRLVLLVEKMVDGGLQRFHRLWGTHLPRQIVAYHGYADAEWIHVHGRVLGKKSYGGPLDDDGWWENLVNTYRRLNSHEVPGVEVMLVHGDLHLSVFTDEEGYYQADFPSSSLADGRLKWITVKAKTGTGRDEIHAVHDIMVPPVSAAFGIISDMDDTVLHTGVTSILLAAKLTFLGNAKTRKPLEGISKLYQELQKGHAGIPENPIFYISSSPWNLYDLLIDFLRLNEIPAGPLMLQDLGVDESRFIKKKGHGHKLQKALRLLDAYPHLSFILIGDSGQEDPAIYAEIAEQHVGRIKAIYIRDVDPGMDSRFDIAVQTAVDKAATVGVPMILAGDSHVISEHAQMMDLIPASAIAPVKEEVVADKSRPDTGEQALQDAVESVLPE